MSIVYRTNGAWGTGQGSNLSPAQVDSNFWWVAQQLTLLSSEISTSVVSIASITVTGSVMTITMTSGTIYTLPLPVAMIQFLGNWQPSTAYVVNDVVNAIGNVYAVIFNHVSGATFDPNANDGAGHNYYQLLLEGVSGEWPPVTTQAGNNRTLTLNDAGYYIRCTSPHTTYISIPDELNVNYAISTEIHFRQASTGSVVIEAISGSDVIVNIPNGFLNHTDRVGATFTIKKVDVDTWDVFGLLAEIGSP